MKEGNGIVKVKEQTLFVAHEQAFLKLFLKLSERKAYRIGFIAELE